MTSTSDAKLSSSPPSLPIADHRELGVALDAVVVDVARRAVARAQLGVVERDRRVEAGVGEPRELAADLGVEPELELAHAEPDQLVGADPAQGGGAARRGGRPASSRGDLGHEHLARLLAAEVRIVRDPDQPVRVPGQQRREVGGGLAGQGRDPLRRPRPSR